MGEYHKTKKTRMVLGVTTGLGKGEKRSRGNHERGCFVERVSA